MSAPRLVVTAGMHGSASTWVFNVARELMIAALGADRVASCFAERVNWLEDPAFGGRHVVMKSHAGSPGWATLVWLTRAPILVSLRDPRDAALSMRARFGVPIAEVERALAADCNVATRAAAAGHMVLRYEDGFFRDPGMPARIAGHLGIPSDAAACEAIFARYATEAVRDFAESIPLLGPERRVGKPGQHMLDKVTQIHRAHIGDGATGKWRTGMTDEEKARFDNRFGPFLRRFGYDLAASGG